MTNSRVGGWTLIAIAIATVLIFMIHPTTVDAGASIGPWGRNVMTHAVALAFIPASGLGVFALGAWLGLDRPLVRQPSKSNLLEQSAGGSFQGWTGGAVAAGAA